MHVIYPKDESSESWANHDYNIRVPPLRPRHGALPLRERKSAALGYMRALAAEVGHNGITVNALSLGTMNNFEGHERAAQSTLIGRAGTPQDVGAAALYLCSDEASWMTGQTIALNGGACTA